jgi:serine/threonine protein kinase
MKGQTLGHYRIIEEIGAGGMGVVYRATDERLERDVAIKVLPAGALADEEMRKRFRREALALSKLNHPNIATIHDFNTEKGVDFLAMEYISVSRWGEVRRSVPEADYLSLEGRVARRSKPPEQGLSTGSQARNHSRPSKGWSKCSTSAWLKLLPRRTAGQRP